MPQARGLLELHQQPVEAMGLRCLTRKGSWPERAFALNQPNGHSSLGTRSLPTPSPARGRET